MLFNVISVPYQAQQHHYYYASHIIYLSYIKASKISRLTMCFVTDLYGSDVSKCTIS